MQSSNKQLIGFNEFICLMAFMISFIALAIDMMLPAMTQIGEDLRFDHPNQVQMIITGVFLGVAAGQLIYGPLSDAFGRKPAVYTGLLLFVVGTLFALFAEQLEGMLIGRFLQGLGAAAPRVVTMAIVRDRYQGTQMARVMSLIMTVFILVPVFAPGLGQLVIMFSDWRMIFWILLLLCFVATIWFALRMPETLTAENKTPLAVKPLFKNFSSFVSHKVAMAYVLALGLMFGAFLTLLSTVQQIFQGIYQLGAMFPVYFAFLALGIGASSFINSRLVVKFGMRPLINLALSVITLSSVTALVFALVYDGVPPLAVLMVYLMLVLLGVGHVFGNLNALIMEPFSHMSGVASSCSGAISTLVAVAFAALVGSFYAERVTPLIIGFIVLGVGALALVFWAGRQSQS